VVISSDGVMFTGIVEEIGTVKDLSPERIAIKASKVLEGTGVGDSISVNGVCLTLTTVSSDGFSVDVMPETIRRTNLGRLHSGDLLNLERAILAGGRVGGHYVQGHVDDTGKILSVKPEEKALLVRMAAPSKLLRYIVNKGFIAVDGVSLTVISPDAFSFMVSLVSFTRDQTTLGIRKPGDIVNLEVDVIAKYVERLQQKSEQEVMLEFLTEQDLSRTR
jgi:riboflavin synthase